MDQPKSKWSKPRPHGMRRHTDTPVEFERGVFPVGCMINIGIIDLYRVSGVDGCSAWLCGPEEYDARVFYSRKDRVGVVRERSHFEDMTRFASRALSRYRAAVSEGASPQVATFWAPRLA